MSGSRKRVEVCAQIGSNSCSNLEWIAGERHVGECDFSHMIMAVHGLEP